ncbi:MAG: ABC-type polysaccharide/polyol phosphate transport system ATPase subunit [Planctomycetota bacterium]|jgi:ABC-type polysaccharide/polyol phosphate transport system ATPase subunit
MFESTDKSKDVNTGSDLIAIQARNLSKVYHIYDKPMKRLVDTLTRSTKRGQEFWALRGVYLDIPKGSTVGIIGENGAGKSTLLKLISGITIPTTGEVKVEGRITSLLELGAGFHPEFSGRENIRLACSILGISGDEAEGLTPEIIEFSELGDFIDQPVKNYSSGMYLRLGFAVATCVNPDVLLIDEALSVGDEYFRGKCMSRLNSFRDTGGTTIFVSHDMGSIRTMCQHVILVDKGEIVEQGPPEKVADEYLKRVKARGNQTKMSMLQRGSAEYPRWGTGEIEVQGVTLFGAEDKAGLAFETGENFLIRIQYVVHEDCMEPVFGIGVYRSDGTYINGSNHHWRHNPIAIGKVEAGETGEVDMLMGALPLLEGQYYLTTFLYDHSKPSPTAIDHREHVVTFQVLDPNHHQHGILKLPSAWAVRRNKPGQDGVETLESSR